MTCNTPVTMDLEPHGQPTHDATTNFLSGWKLSRSIVQSVETRRYRDFRLAHVTCRRFLFPEAISGAEIKEVISSNVWIRNVDPGGNNGESW